MYCVYILKNLKNKRLFIGYANDFNEEFKKHHNSVLVSVETCISESEANKLEKYLKSEKGLLELKNKIKKRTLGKMEIF